MRLTINRTFEFGDVPTGCTHPGWVPLGFPVGAVSSLKLDLYTSGHVGHSDELAEATQAGDVDPAVLSEIALRYSMDVIGPVPETDVWRRHAGLPRPSRPRRYH